MCLKNKTTENISFHFFEEIMLSLNSKPTDLSQWDLRSDNYKKSILKEMLTNLKAK